MKNSKLKIVGVFKSVEVLFLMALFYLGIFLLTKFFKIEYLSSVTISSFLSEPFTILFLLLVVLLFFALFWIEVLTLTLQESYPSCKVKSLLSILFTKLKKLKKKSIFLLLALASLPLGSIYLLTLFFIRLLLPSFLLNTFSYKFVSCSILFLILLLSIILYNCLYVPYLMLNETSSFKEAYQKSKELLSTHHYKEIKVLGCIELISVGFFLLLTKGFFFLQTIIPSLPFLILLILFCFLYIIGSEVVNFKVFFSFLNIEKKEEKAKTWSQKEKIILGSLIGISLLVNIFFLICKENIPIDFDRTPKIMAHRGYSKFYPENTMKAFQKAKKVKSDFIELDVQQTKDGILVISHDSNIKRRTGINANIFDLTYEELKKLDFGEGERIPTLEEVLQFAKEKHINLNIELKPTGKEIDFEKSVVDLILKYELQENVVVTSFSYDSINKVKENNASIKIGYTMNQLNYDLSYYTNVDAFSIQYANVHKNTVDTLHTEKKEIYAWTLNEEDAISKMLKLNVDAIITDDVGLAKKVIHKNQENKFYKWFS